MDNVVIEKIEVRDCSRNKDMEAADVELDGSVIAVGIVADVVDGVADAGVELGNQQVHLLEGSSPLMEEVFLSLVVVDTHFLDWECLIRHPIVELGGRLIRSDLELINQLTNDIQSIKSMVTYPLGQEF